MTRRPDPLARLVTCCAAGLRRLARLGAALLLLAALACGMLFLAMREGPVTMPGLATLIEHRLGGAHDIALSIGAARLGFAARGGPTVHLEDVRIDDGTGGDVLSVPRVALTFSGRALTRGVLAPVRLSIARAEAALIRAADGRIRLAMAAPGSPPPPAPGAPPVAGYGPPEAGTVGAQTLTRVFDGLSGSAPLPEAMRDLRLIEITEARLRLEAEITGRAILAEGATLTLTRRETGLEGRIEAPLVLPGGRRVTLKASGRRPQGGRATELALTFADLPLATLADDIPEIAFLAGIDAPVSGSLAARLTASGAITEVTGELTAGAGALVLDDERLPVAHFETGFAFDPEAGRLVLDYAELVGPVLSAELRGHAMLARDAAGLPRTIEADLTLGRSVLSLPGMLDQSVIVERGHAVVAADLDGDRIDIATLSLERDDLVLSVEGRLDPGRDGLRGALRIAGENLSVADIQTFWPAGAARNARAWIREHLVTGRVPRLVGHLGLAPGDATLALDFDFEALEAAPLDGMPPITGASGRATVTTKDLVLALETGTVEAEAGQAVDLAGSSLRIWGFDAPVTPADIDIRAAGPVAGVLAVIDRPPLGLVGRLGLPLGRVSGGARLSARLAFPLIQELRIEEIDVAVDSRLDDVAMTLGLPGTGPLALAASRLDIAADAERLTLRGPVSLAGSTLAVTWEERYGAAPGRRLVLDGPLALDTLRAFEVLPPGFAGGPFAIEAVVTQEGDARPGFTLDADLASLAIDPPTLTWRKRAGAAARLSAAGRLGDGVTLDRAEVTGPGLSILGSGRIGESGDMALNVDRLRVGGLVDLSGEVVIDGSGRRLDLQGALLDVGLLRQAEEEEEARPDATGDDMLPAFSLSLDVARLVLAEGFAVMDASGTVDRPAGGTLAGRFSGALNGAAPVTARLSLPPEGQGAGALVLESDDAGAFLRAADLAAEAQGGTLRLDAVLPGGGLDRIRGTVTMRNIQLTEGSTFERIVRDGDLDEEIEVEGLGFDTVEMPFRYDAGRIAIDNAIATGPKLAVRLSGTVDRTANRLDLRGVASPAYALSGFLDSIPVLGRILTGRRGEGILGLTFSVTGSPDDPSISVNPLSILVPGILRDLFSAGRTGDFEGEGEGPVAGNPGSRSRPRPGLGEIDLGGDR